jgi:hypothetical protein
VAVGSKVAHPERRYLRTPVTPLVVGADCNVPAPSCLTQGIAVTEHTAMPTYPAAYFYSLMAAEFEKRAVDIQSHKLCGEIEKAAHICLRQSATQ